MQYDIYGGGATVLKTHLLLLCGLLCEQSLHSSEVLGLGYLQGIKLDYCCSLGSFANVLNKIAKNSTLKEIFNCSTLLLAKFPSGPADGLVISGHSLALDESSMTGESKIAMSTPDKQPTGSNYRECVMLGINTGIDMVMVPFKFEVLWNDFPSLAESGEIPMARIDDDVERILNP
nr:Glycosyl hydrolase family protein [Ipomoea batatas]